MKEALCCIMLSTAAASVASLGMSISAVGRMKGSEAMRKAGFGISVFAAVAAVLNVLYWITRIALRA